MVDFSMKSDPSACVCFADMLCSRVHSLVCDLNDPVSSFPGRLDSCMEELRGLFDAEEILMIRTRYPDYTMQQMAHRCFLRGICTCRLCPEEPGAAEAQACKWLIRHEETSGRLFRLYLQRHVKKDPDIPSGNPDLVILSTKIIS